ncbi:ParB/RepB/Spo0J family partition protein [Anabaena azotica]|uniref:ParB/RepB/Spo0J family partition protein n=1 Tax=Anabaena azotica TaxID=197653 RepID=UPI0039A6D31E
MSKKDAAYTAKLKHANPIDLMFGGNDDESTKPENNSTNTIPIQEIKLPPTQPRLYFDPKKLEELALSIKELGILEPLLVRPRPDRGYELIAGERRFKAALMAGLEAVPVVIKEMDDNTVKQVQLIENLQREDLNAYEETIGILELLALRLFKTPDEVISLLNRMAKANRKPADNVIRPTEKQVRNNDDDVLHPANVSIADNVIRPTEKQGSNKEGDVIHPANASIADNVIRPTEKQGSNNSDDVLHPDNASIANNVIRPTEKQGGNNSDDVLHPDNVSIADNVIRPEEKEVVESIFASLGRLSAESFRTNRLPLLNLPEDIKEALQNGSIEYTKARAIAKLKDDAKRAALLQTAINENLSLTEIQQRIRNILQQEKADTTPSLKTQYKELSKQLGSSKVWDNPKKKKALEKLLNQIKILLDEEQVTLDS